MRYIITESQYKKLLSEEDEPTTSSFKYGTQMTDASSSDGGGWTYGKQMNTTGGTESSGSSTGSTTNQSTKFTPFVTKIFNDKESKNFAGNYRVKGMKKLPNNFLEVELESSSSPFKVTTDCGKLGKGDISFKYGNSQLFSKELATSVGQTFGCKLKV